MDNKLLKLIIVFALLLAILPAVVSAAEMVTDGGFESGGVTAWTTQGTVTSSSTYPHSGTYRVAMTSGSSYTKNTSMSQKVDFTGSSNLSFWYLTGTSGTNSNWKVSCFVDDVEIWNTTETTVATWKNVIITNQTGYKTLEFRAYNDGTAWIARFDDISVQRTGEKTALFNVTYNRRFAYQPGGNWTFGYYEIRYNSHFGCSSYNVYWCSYGISWSRVYRLLFVWG